MHYYYCYVRLDGASPKPPRNVQKIISEYAVAAILLCYCSCVLYYCGLRGQKKKITFSYIVKLAVQSTKASDYNAEQRK